MKRLLIAMAALALTAAYAQTQPQLSGEIVRKAGEKEVIYLSFKDQAAADKGRDTAPVTVPVSKDGTFRYPASLPIGFTVATTPPCVDLEAILVKSAKEGAALVNLLDQFKPSSVTPPGVPKLGNATQTKMDQFSILNGLFNWTSQQTQMADKIVNGDAALGLGKFGIGGSATSLIGGVNLGCRNEKKPQGGAK